MRSPNTASLFRIFLELLIGAGEVIHFGALLVLSLAWLMCLITTIYMFLHLDDTNDDPKNVIPYTSMYVIVAFPILTCSWAYWDRAGENAEELRALQEQVTESEPTTEIQEE